MAKKVLFSLIILVIGFSFWLFWPKNSSLLQSPQSQQAEVTVPSKTLISYEDPSGFKFDYPDNLSISIQEVGDQAIYSSLQLYSKKTDGSLSVTVSDTALKDISGWMKENNFSLDSIKVKDIKIGSLPAKEITTSDRIYIVAIDNGILFTFESPKLNEKFWMPVYEKIAGNFTFGAPETVTAQAAQTAVASEELIFFEGEETVE